MKYFYLCLLLLFSESLFSQNGTLFINTSSGRQAIDVDTTAGLAPVGANRVNNMINGRLVGIPDTLAAHRNAINLQQSTVSGLQSQLPGFASKDSTNALRGAISGLQAAGAGFVSKDTAIALRGALGSVQALLPGYASKDSITTLRGSISAVQNLLPGLALKDSVLSHRLALAGLQGQFPNLAPKDSTAALRTALSSAQAALNTANSTITALQQQSTLFASKDTTGKLRQDLSTSMAQLAQTPTKQQVSDTLNILKSTITAIDSSVNFYYNLSGAKIYAKTRTYRGFVVPTTGNNFTINLVGLNLTGIIGFTATYVHPATGLLSMGTMTVLSTTTTSLVFAFTQPLAVVLGGNPLTYTTDFSNSGIWITFTATY